MKFLRPVCAASLAAATVLAVSGCGGSSSSASATPMSSMTTVSITSAPVNATTPVTGPAATGPHNTQDIEFAQGMIPHHAQAVQMADLILARTDNAQVKALAVRIKAAQAPEIARMSGWLTGWGEKVPTTAMAGGMDMGGMMSEADMAKLKSAPMGKADEIFLTLMPEHHQGAIAMAKMELSDGANPEAKKLAQSIIDSQTAEITEMKALLTSIS
jgi:uncharacterized protein (DUF305 family)